MGTIDNQNIQPQLDAAGTGDVFNNVKRLRAGDGKWRFENGALIITDETGIDRILIGYLKNKF